MQYQQAIATEAGAAAQEAQNAERSLACYRLLQRISPAAVAQEQIDAAIATEKNANAQRDAARGSFVSLKSRLPR